MFEVLTQITLRDLTGREVVAQFRRASLGDIPEIERLIKLSARFVPMCKHFG
jgi:hypothetical protein